MEINQPLDSEISAIDVSSDSKSHLLGAAKWARFIAIAGFVFLGFFLLIFFATGSMFLTVGLSNFELDAMKSGAAILFVAFMSALIFFPNYYLYKFSSGIITAILSSSTIDLTNGLKNLKSVFKFYGILFALQIGIYGILFLLSIFS